MSAAVIQGAEFRNDLPNHYSPFARTPPRSSTSFYDVTPDGRFLMVTGGDVDSGYDDLILVENWFDELKAKMQN